MLFGNGDGTFETALSFGMGLAPRSLTVADVDGDNALAIVSAHQFSETIAILINVPEPAQTLLVTAAFGTLAPLRRRQR